MKLLTMLSILSAFYQLEANGNPQPCTSPKLLEGHICRNRFGTSPDAVMAFSYDAVHKRIYVDQVRITQGVPGERLVDYLLFKQKVVYQFYPKNGTCVKYPLDIPFRPIGTPPNGTYMNQVYLGTSASPVDGLLVNIWGLKSDAGFEVLTFTAHGCFPVSKMANDKRTGWSIETFLNITTGIRDPGIFDPPKECFKED